MNYPLTFHTEVETDVDDAYNWYEDRQAELGERFLEELSVCYLQLEDHPEFYSRVGKRYRRMKVKHFPHVVVFEIVGDEVFVYAVFHTSRNPRDIMKRKRS